MLQQYSVSINDFGQVLPALGMKLLTSTSFPVTVTGLLQLSV